MIQGSSTTCLHNSEYMHFTQFIMHKYIRAYSRLYASTRVREGLYTSQEERSPQVNTNILTGVHHDIIGYCLKDCRVHKICCRKKKDPAVPLFCPSSRHFHRLVHQHESGLFFSLQRHEMVNYLYKVT